MRRWWWRRRLSQRQMVTAGSSRAVVRSAARVATVVAAVKVQERWRRRGGDEEVSVKVEEQADEQAETEEVVAEEEEAIAEAMVTAVSPRANRLCDDPSLAWAHAAASSLYPPPRAHSGPAPRGGRAARPLRAAASACNRRTIEPPRAAQPSRAPDATRRSMQWLIAKTAAAGRGGRTTC
jgi:hypothetical protein